MRQNKIAVIGAGPCGLAACKVLQDYGLAFECLEAGSRLGGTWNIESGGAGYASLQTNTSTTGMAFSDFAFQEGEAAYLNAQQMLEYFQRYANHFKLNSHIRLNQRVTRAVPANDGTWDVTLATGETITYHGVIVATGQYTAPRMPHDSIAGHFAGQYLHVYDYMDATSPVDLRGKRVVVVGLGSSAAELAAELSNPPQPDMGASQVILSARSGRWVVPKISQGVPIDAQSLHPSARLPALLRAMPTAASQWLVRRAMGKMLRGRSQEMGGQEALGLPAPDIDPWEERPTLSVDFIPALQAGLIDVKPGIERFDGNIVTFTDGSTTEADVILYATGYQLNFPFLDLETLGIEDSQLALYQRVVHPNHEKLFFVGFCRAMCSLWPIAEQQSHWIARLLAEEFRLPPQSKRMRNAVPLAKSLPIMCNVYVEGLRTEAGTF